MDKNLILVFDVGNTNIKYGLFKKNMLLESGFCMSWSLNDWEDFFDRNKVSHVFIGNKSSFSIKISHFFPEKCNVILSEDLVKIPFKTYYKNKNKLGLDRKALISGAMFVKPSSSLLVIDAGTCITYDLIYKTGMHKSGAITPGIETRLHSMHLFTSKLPLLSNRSSNNKSLSETEMCMLLGVQRGVFFEIDSFIENFKKDYGMLTTICSGGDSNLIYKNLKNNILLETDLVLKGLYVLLSFNKLI